MCVFVSDNSPPRLLSPDHLPLYRVFGPSDAMHHDFMIMAEPPLHYPVFGGAHPHFRSNQVGGDSCHEANEPPRLQLVPVRYQEQTICAAGSDPKRKCVLCPIFVFVPDLYFVY